MGELLPSASERKLNSQSDAITHLQEQVSTLETAAAILVLVTFILSVVIIVLAMRV